jgi:ATP-dependent helicase/nuclease subunit A
VGGSSGAAKSRGSQLHLLLEHLPLLPRPEWEAAARWLLDDALSADNISLLAEAKRCVDAAPEVFAPDSLAEVDISAHIPALDGRISGAIDRLIVGETHIRAVDFKSNIVVPTRQEDVPDGILRQMGAYLEALVQIWPDRSISIEVLWTATGKLMVLEHAIVRRALANAPTS